MKILILMKTQRKEVIKMGYTHHWRQTRNFKEHEWKMIEAATNELCKKASVLDKDPKSSQRLRINADEIIFNGIGEDGHETFHVTRLKPAIASWDHEGQDKKQSFGFCKTNRKYYDDYVIAVLAIIDHLAPGVLLITSDGEEEDWISGYNKAKKVLPNAQMVKFKDEEYESWKKAV